MKEEKIFRKIKGARKIIQACLISDFLRQLTVKNIKENLKNSSQALLWRKLKERLWGV
jgi:hypothetical protein